MRKKTIFLIAGVGALSATTLVGCNKNQKTDEYTKDGKLKISMRNLYFDDYQGGDYYIRQIEKKFEVKIKFNTYSWANWSTQVTGQVNGGNLPDVFHANIDSYNFANSYKFWANEHIIKPLPEDLSAWPNIQNMIEHTSNIDALKINGKLYGIPISKNTTDFSTSFSPFTYIYRRDWAKKYGVYQENDEYTWEQFITLLSTFKTSLAPAGRYALGDVEWGFPSIINFYKQVPHCFAFDETKGDHGKYVNNYTTEAYITGLKKSKEFMNNRNGYYYPAQNEARDGDVNTQYCSSKIGVFYENLSYSNYYTIRETLRKNNASLEGFNLDDATAIMKIKGPDGMYALEGTDNWFSMTFFDNQISKKKQEKILDLIDWLLSEEGTRYAIYGEEGYDYVIEEDPDTGEESIELVPESWPKGTDGRYARKDNGAKFLRYLASLGYDTLSYDPLTEKDAVEYLENWEREMNYALKVVEDDPETPEDESKPCQLKVLKENAEVMWLTSSKKSQFSGQLRTDALKTVMNYVYNSGVNDSNYKSQFGSTWSDVLAEINRVLGYN